jgi:GR25 family glycosyltransferase involved in LPS biosynthesis
MNPRTLGFKVKRSKLQVFNKILLDRVDCNRYLLNYNMGKGEGMGMGMGVDMGVGVGMGVNVHSKPSKNIIQQNKKPKDLLLHGPWFPELQHGYVISIRKKRWRLAYERFVAIRSYIQLLEGTNGVDIDKIKWLQQGKILSNCRLKRGQLGCFDSHRRAWSKIVNSKFPFGLILEDDADFHPQKKHVYKKINKALDQLKLIDSDWDILFLARSIKKQKNISLVAPGLVIPGKSWGLFAYVISQNGARKLFEKSLPFKIPVDEYVSDRTPELKKYALWPSLCYVKEVRSDTRNII